MHLLKNFVFLVTALIHFNALGTQFSCDDVSIKSLYSLDLGEFKMRAGDTGWIFTERSGFTAVSNNISIAADSQVSAGVIRVHGPKGSKITLSLKLHTNDLDDELIKIKSLHMYGTNFVEPLRISTGVFELTLPERLDEIEKYNTIQSDKVNADLQVGVEALLKGSFERTEKKYKIVISCMTVDHL